MTLPRRVALAHWDSYELTFRLAKGETSPLAESIIPNLRAGNVSGFLFAIGGDSDEHSGDHEDPLVGTIAIRDQLLKEVASASDDITIAFSSSDIEAAEADGKIWMMLSIEGSRPLRGTTEVLDVLYELGVRSVGLTWNGRNEVGDGVGVDNPGGLTKFGRSVVRAMNKKGMIIDVSHFAPKGLEDVLSISSTPVMATHSNARALSEHPRNLTDEQIRAIGDAGGVIGINFLATFLAPNLESLSPESPPTVNDVVRQVLYIGDLIGIENVLVGGDLTYDPWRAEIGRKRSYQGVPVGIGMSVRAPVHEFPETTKLVDALDGSGLTTKEIEGVLNGNLARHIREVLA